MSLPPKGYVGAYSSNQRDTESGRSLEARALLNCAAKLEQVRRIDCPRLDYGEALRANMRLWSVFQVSITDPTNPLPQEIKLNLFRLSRYVDKISFGAFARKDVAIDILGELITINRQIAAGLSANNAPKPQQAPAVQPPPADMKPIEITT